MERVTIDKAAELFGNNFIGPKELIPLLERLGIENINISIPEIHYSIYEIQSYVSDYILILGIDEVNGTDITIKCLRDKFGVDPDINEPCFYNQDWYLTEEFYKEKTLECRWYLIKKRVIEDTRKVQPDTILESGLNFPTAILCTFTFLHIIFPEKNFYGIMTLSGVVIWTIMEIVSISGNIMILMG